MTTRKSPLRRIAAAVSALALVGASAVAFSAPASAEGQPSLPDKATGSITLHKHAEASGSSDTKPAGPALGGIRFTYQEVGQKVNGTCTEIDLSTTEGWALAKLVVDGFNKTTGVLGNDTCLIGTPTNFPLTSSADDATKGTTQANYLPIGLYFINETDPGDHLVSQSIPFLATVPMLNDDKVSWNYDLVAYPKNKIEKNEPSKTIQGNSGTQPLLPGATLNWTITVPLPKLKFGYNVIEITDVMTGDHDSLTFGEVKLGATTLDSSSHYTVTGNVLKFEGPGLAEVNLLSKTQGQTLTIKVTTKVKALADPATLTNKADVKLNAKTESTGIPRSYWGEITILKHEQGDTAKTLEGAKFNVYALTAATCQESVDAVGATPLVTGLTTGPGGTISQVLWVANADTVPANPLTRTYCIVETQAPAGFILDSAARTVTLSTSTTEANPALTWGEKVPNSKPSSGELPLTGAGGTLAMTVSGLVLMGAGAGAIAVSRRRSHKA